MGGGKHDTKTNGQCKELKTRLMSKDVDLNGRQYRECTKGGMNMGLEACKKSPQTVDKAAYKNLYVRSGFNRLAYRKYFQSF